MTPIERQFEQLRVLWPEAAITGLADGSYLITVPSVELPPGWNKARTDVVFIAPVGYPLAKPDCFWTDFDLRLANGGLPQNSQQNQIPHLSDQRWWFSWHLASWNPNTDNLMTYFNVIKCRLQQAV
ncbi:MAG TPA: E2/UBC family protein [Cyclobacteriaceae bacterium]|nr:hypothetical protein [Cyclobacteriaceae bacterium]HMV09289.1 E2/UBC family protein [Cyclobacteriaceae bacterium]HMX01911.1 E2/UBC family protein [Cyclobacteriaceae bacterium]HMX50834.1 E2/UBC family protein [Cyclobacteriaceae bacterium]HMY94734.1 E2/UBC family protein [Cyclobacteriaceae bacterium]